MGRADGFSVMFLRKKTCQQGSMSARQERSTSQGEHQGIHQTMAVAGESRMGQSRSILGACEQECERRLRQSKQASISSLVDRETVVPAAATRRWSPESDMVWAGVRT